MADIVDRHIVMLAPEERHGVKLRALTKQIQRRSLALLLGNDPMLNPNVRSGVAIWPTRNIACGKDPRDARFEVLIDQDSMVGCKPRILGKGGAWTNANTSDHKIGVQLGATSEPNPVLLYSDRSIFEVENDAIFLVQ